MWQIDRTDRANQQEYQMVFDASLAWFRAHFLEKGKDIPNMILLNVGMNILLIEIVDNALWLDPIEISCFLTMYSIG